MVNETQNGTIPTAAAHPMLADSTLCRERRANARQHAKSPKQ